MDEDIKAFLADSHENLEQIERDLVNLEQDPTDKELLARIYRALHTIKGNCGFMAFSKLEALTHAGENLLSCLRDGQLVLNADITDSLLQLLDAIQQSCSCIEAIGQEGEFDYSELIEKLQNLQPLKQQAQSKIIALQVENIRSSLSTSLSVPVNNTEIVDLTKSDLYGENGKKNAPLKNDRPPTASTAAKAIPSIRVDINLLDKLMNLVGELVLVRNQILQFNSREDEAAFEATSQHLNRLTTELQEGVMKTRMQPISKIWSKYPRVVRDMAIASGKQVQVEMEGEETELDKTIIEAIKDPLTQIIRNSVDHGIETPQMRKIAGKSESGNLYLQAFQESGYVNIQITDDGAGIDPEQLKQKAFTLGLITAEQLNRLSDNEAINLIFLPGFSTADQVTRLSGRGVGMDIVKSHIEKVGGTVEVCSQKNLGTTFKLKIPLTLAIIHALIVSSGGDRYAIPQMSLAELVRLEGEQARHGIEYIHKVPVYRLRGKLLPLVYLNQELQLQDTQEEVINIVVIQASTPFGLVVDAINDTQEIVVKPLGKLLKDTPCFAGATILGDGNIALILDLNSIAHCSGLLTEAQTKARLKQEAATHQPIDDCQQMFLLFEGSPNSRMAIPLYMVLRLEEIKNNSVEKVGNQTVIQYRERILPLIDLTNYSSARLLNSNRRKRVLSRAKTSHSSLLGTKIIQVVVVNCHNGKTVGLVVNRILDIVMENLTITGAASRPGVQAIAAIQGQVTEILDIEAITQGII